MTVEAAEALKQRGNDLFAQKHYRDAELCFTEALGIDPKCATYYANRAAVRVKLAQYEAALEDCTAASTLDPSYTKAYTRATSCLLNLGRWDEALAVPHSTAGPLIARIRRLADLVEHARWSEAVSLGQAVVRECIAPEVQVLVARALLGARRDQEAKTLAMAVAQRDPGNLEALAVASTALLYTGNTPLAKKYLQEALRHDPDNKRCAALFKRIRRAEKLKDKATGLFKDGAYRDAAQGFAEAAGVDPRHADFNAAVLCNMAAAYMKLAEWAEAVDACDAALEAKAGEYPKAVRRRAECRMQMQEYEAAARDYETLCRLDGGQDRDLQAKLREAKLEAKKAKRKDYYKILGVDSTESAKGIKKAYYRLAQTCHPDKVSSDDPEAKQQAEERFKSVSEAYSILSDPEKRRQFDSGVDLDDPHGGMGGHGMGGMDMEEMMNMFYGGGGGGFGGHGGGFGGGHGGAHHFRFG